MTYNLIGDQLILNQWPIAVNFTDELNIHLIVIIDWTDWECNSTPAGGWLSRLSSWERKLGCICFFFLIFLFCWCCRKKALVNEPNNRLLSITHNQTHWHKHGPSFQYRCTSSLCFIEFLMNLITRAIFCHFFGFTSWKFVDILVFWVEIDQNFRVRPKLVKISVLYDQN